MSLFISNPTKQDWTFYYRDLASAPEARLLHQLKVPSGRQVEVGHGWARDQIAHVVAQLEAAGAHDAAEASRPIAKFQGLLYRVNGQIEEREIVEAHDSVVATQQARSVNEATKAALGFDRALNAQSKGRRAARSSTVEVIEQLGPHARATGNEVNFSLTVDPDGNQAVRLNS